MSDQSNDQTKPLVTVYIPSHNYGKYLPQAVDSMLSQIFGSWELIIINDGSTDDSLAISQQYQEKHADKIRLINNEKSQGLQICANIALREARGDYFMRLDADDYLDESALLVMTTYLNNHKEVGLVYPNYTYVNEKGEFLAIESRKKIGNEASLLDLPAHGACTLIRKRILKSIGGYSEDYKVQDGYDLWLKVLHRYPVGNVSTPLFYYRQHSTSQSKNEDKILSTRAKIKRERAKLNEGPVKPKTVAVIGAKNTYDNLSNIVLNNIAGKPLIDYTLDPTIKSQVFDEIVVSTDDGKVKDYCAKKHPSVKVILRDETLSNERVSIDQVVHDCVRHLEEDFQYYPDIIVQLNLHAPLRTQEHTQKAIDSLLLYNTDTVISVYEDLDLHYVHGKYGLKAISRTRHEQLRIEREALYVNNNALRVTWRDAIEENKLTHLKMGHIVMTKKDSFHIHTPFDLWLIENILANRLKEASI